MGLALLFPGQGSQSLKMMDGLAHLPVVRDTFDQASSYLNVDLWGMLQADTADEINATIHTQPLMLTAGIAVWRAWLALGGVRPGVVAGHSLGEYTALVAADVLDFLDAVKLVRLRAELMQQAVPSDKGAMAAVLGLDDHGVREACREASQVAGVVEAANYNAPGQVIIAGEINAVERALEYCKARGAKRALRLPVSVPSHCCLMRQAADQLRSALAPLVLRTPNIRVLHNVDVHSYQKETEIRDALIRQLYLPVRWAETIQQLRAEGYTLMLECGPGRVLTGLVKRIDSSITCLALTDQESLDVALTSCSR